MDRSRAFTAKSAASLTIHNVSGEGVRPVLSIHCHKTNRHVVVSQSETHLGSVLPDDPRLLASGLMEYLPQYQDNCHCA